MTGADCQDALNFSWERGSFGVFRPRRSPVPDDDGAVVGGGHDGAVNADELRARAHEVARTLPGSQLDRPFGPDWDVYKVRGRIFALLTETTGPQMLTLRPTRRTARRCAASTRTSPPAIT